MSILRVQPTSSACILRQFILVAMAVTGLFGNRLLAAELPGGDFALKMHKAAPAVFQYLQEKGYKNVGVLKFRVKKPDEPPSDKVGTLNMFAARRLEVALVLANPFDPEKQIGIVQNASSVAAQVPGASHVTAAGRALLFSSQYPLAWGEQSVQPDAFLTGIIMVEKDWRTMKVGILAFDRSDEKLRLVAKFDAGVDVAILDELSESFLVRGAFDGGSTKIKKPSAEPPEVKQPEVKQPEVKDSKIVQTAQRVKSQDEKFPLVDESAPITLEVLYDGTAVPLDLKRKAGEAQIPEPSEGQRVTFVIRRAAATKQRLAIVLKVNGENTLFREKLPAEQCTKWILEPELESFGVAGYQFSDDEIETFRVLSAGESKANEVDYGEDVGTISLVVFREQVAGPPGDLPPEETSEEQQDLAEDLLALTRGAFPKNKPQNLAALKFQLRSGDSLKRRGLIAQGEKAASRITRTTFKTDPSAVMVATIRYYKP